jgi:putative endonuclease
MNYMSKLIGQHYETEALRFLQQRGLKLLTRNFLVKAGEIDLIMQDGNTLVFVEVRYRHSKTFGSSKETVTYAKQQKLIRAAQSYLLQYPQYSHFPCRFDLIAIDRSIEWLQNAFMLN